MWAPGFVIPSIYGYKRIRNRAVPLKYGKGATKYRWVDISTACRRLKSVPRVGMGGSRIGSEVVLALTEAAALRGGTWYVLAGDEGDVWRLSLSIVHALGVLGGDDDGVESTSSSSTSSLSSSLSSTWTGLTYS